MQAVGGFIGGVFTCHFIERLAISDSYERKKSKVLRKKKRLAQKPDSEHELAQIEHWLQLPRLAAINVEPSELGSYYKQ